LVAGLFVAGSPPSLGTVELEGRPRELQLVLRPGVTMLQAAKQAPRALAALPRAARRLGELSLLDGRYLSAVSAGLLDEGLLLPGPLGMVEVRTIAPEPPAAHHAAAPPDPGCQPESAPSSLVGAYRAGPRLLLLRADGAFVLTGGPLPERSGRYLLRCQSLQLTGADSAPLRLVPADEKALDRSGWRTDSGVAFLPLTEQPDGDHR
jgi:hypothetical protein